MFVQKMPSEFSCNDFLCQVPGRSYAKNFLGEKRERKSEISLGVFGLPP